MVDRFLFQSRYGLGLSETHGTGRVSRRLPSVAVDEKMSLKIQKMNKFGHEAVTSPREA